MPRMSARVGDCTTTSPRFDSRGMSVTRWHVADVMFKTLSGLHANVSAVYTCLSTKADDEAGVKPPPMMTARSPDTVSSKASARFRGPGS